MHNRLVDGFRLISNSEIQTFKQCRRKWWLQWFRGLVLMVESVKGVRNTGTRIHVALAEYYVPGGSEKAAFKALIKAQEEDRVTHGKIDPDLEKDFSLEIIMLEGYFQWLAETGADSNLDVVSSEQYMEAEFLDGNKDTPPVKIIGKVDTRLRDKRDGKKKFIDHKTVQTFENPLLLGINEQTLHYQLLEWLSGDGDDYCTAALYNMMRRVRRTAKAVPPFYQRVVIERNRHEMDAYRRRLTGVITDIQTVEQKLTEEPELLPMLVYPTPSRDCTWKCPFFQECRLFDDGSRAEAALESRFMIGDPLEYYQGKERDE